MAETTIPENALHSFVDALDKANMRTAKRFPGDSPARQPVHTVYGGAHLFKADAAQKLGSLGLKSLQDHAPDGATLARALDLPAELADRVYLRVVDKLTREPVEDFRIDFEDGFGTRPDDEEDRVAKTAADEVAAGMTANSLPPSIGIRIKTLNEELKRRSLRTFDLFRRDCSRRLAARCPLILWSRSRNHFAGASHGNDLGVRCVQYRRDIAKDTLRFELMIETPQSVFAADGTIALPRSIAEGNGRIVAAHFGTTITPPRWASPRRINTCFTRSATSRNRSWKSRWPAPASGCRTVRPTSCRLARVRWFIRRGDSTLHTCATR